MHLLFLKGRCVVLTAALVYNGTDSYFADLFKAALDSMMKDLVYVSVWLNQAVLEDCVILSYVSELCSITFVFFCFFFGFTQHCFEWSLYTGCIILMLFKEKHFL